MKIILFLTAALILSAGTIGGLAVAGLHGLPAIVIGALVGLILSGATVGRVNKL